MARKNWDGTEPGEPLARATYLQMRLKNGTTARLTWEGPEPVRSDIVKLIEILSATADLYPFNQPTKK